jgi:hypothetical protein
MSKNGIFSRGICLVFIQYMNIYSGMRNQNKSLARLWIISRTFQGIEGASGKVFQRSSVLCGSQAKLR